MSIHAYSPPLSGLTYYERTRFGFIARELIEEERRSTFRTTQPHLENYAYPPALVATRPTGAR